jgi:CMP/dCMP kinase
MIITIDGPAGSGKSTTARNLAQKLGISYLDTGATYRAVTLRALRNGVNLADEAAMLTQAREIDLKMTPAPDGVRVEMDSNDVSLDIRSEEVSREVHYAANSRIVRKVLVELQRKMGKQLGSFVSEGRDQGTVVFPDADVKFYVDADTCERAERRYKEQVQRGVEAGYDSIREAIIKRDENDKNREVGALRVPEGGIIIDTTIMTPEEVVEKLLEYIREKF